MIKRRALLLVSGDGGHLVQLKRLLKVLKLKHEFPDLMVVLLTDSDRHLALNGVDVVIRVPQLRHKTFITITIFFFIFRFLLNFYRVVKIFVEWDVKFIITTGPGVAFLPLFFGRVLNIKSLFIETWSKFRSLTKTGSIVRFFVSFFLYRTKNYYHL
jgi:UDP-N-acetylglucosamine:LPS N-acetylglucosamine transferase